MVGSCPHLGKVAPPRILVSLAAGVHDDVAVILRPFEGASDLRRVALVDDNVDLARLAVGEVGEQLVQFVPLIVASLRNKRRCISYGRWVSGGAKGPRVFFRDTYYVKEVS